MRTIEQAVAELREYTRMAKELEDTIEALKDEVKRYMADNAVDEVVTDAGKCTWRETVSKRFDSTAFKKDFSDVYQEYCRPTTYKRFTFN